MAPNRRENDFLFPGRKGGKQLERILGIGGEHSGALRRILRRNWGGALLFS